MSEKKKDIAGGQPLLETSIKALYVAAGVTDVLAERLKEYAEHKQDEARAKRERRNEQIAHASGLARELPKKAQAFVADAPNLAKTMPEQVQDQLEALLTELNLGFEEMATRGEARINEVRHQTASTARRGARSTSAQVDEAQADFVESIDDLASSVDTAQPKVPAAKKAPAKRAAKSPGSKPPTAKAAKAPVSKAAAAKKPVAKKAPATKAPVAKAPATKTPATKAPAKKATPQPPAPPASSTETSAPQPPLNPS